MSFTAAAIAEFAFQALIEAGAGNLAEKFTDIAVQKIGELRRAVVERLKGRSQKVDEALVLVESGDKEALPTLAKNLDVAMDEDPEFAQMVQTLAIEIDAGSKEDNSSMVMNVTGEHATGTQIKNNVENRGGENYTGSVTVNKNYYSGPPQD